MQKFRAVFQRIGVVLAENGLSFLPKFMQLCFYFLVLDQLLFVCLLHKPHLLSQLNEFCSDLVLALFLLVVGLMQTLV